MRLFVLLTFGVLRLGRGARYASIHEKKRDREKRGVVERVYCTLMSVIQGKGWAQLVEGLIGLVMRQTTMFDACVLLKIHRELPFAFCGDQAKAGWIKFGKS